MFYCIGSAAERTQQKGDAHVKKLLLLPCLLLAYVFLLGLTCLFAGWIEPLFAGNLFYMLAAMFAYLVVSVVCTAVFFHLVRK